jgi:hypothetical protein
VGPATTSTTAPSATVTTSSTTTTGLLGKLGSIPEFPLQLGFTLLATVVIVTSYVFARRGLRTDKGFPV